MDIEITFIIPTIGRETLKNSINSLLNQSINNWKAIIIFDGIKSNFAISDDRIKIIEIEKKGININNAGEVRNYGMSLVDTEWIGFLDDDDILADDYIELFYKELEINRKEIDVNYNNSEYDVFIFRMKMNNRIIPKLDTDNFYLCDVGISFIINKKIYDSGLKFIPDGAEDYLYLDNIRKNGYNIVILPYIKYFVRQDNYIDENILGNRVLIKNNLQLNKQNSFFIFIGYYFLNNIKG